MQGKLNVNNGVAASIEPQSTEVLVRKGRRRFTTKYIEAVLKEIDEAPHGEKGMIVRREGLYSTQIHRAAIMKQIETRDTDLPASVACQSLSLPKSTFYHRTATPAPRSEPKARPRPVRALSLEEREQAYAVLTSAAYIDKSPAQISAHLLDSGQYLCSERTFYRILRQYVVALERRSIARHVSYSAPELLATAPGKVWTWDITKLKGPRRGDTYNLFVVLDMYSRYVVGWLLAHREQDVLASDLLQECCTREGIEKMSLVIHADNGSSMRSHTVADLLIRLGITKSHSRPYCSNDNPYSEAHFKTMKYSPGFPERFDSIDDAREFCKDFFLRYNHHMYHSGLAMLTPAMVHFNIANTVISARQNVLTNAYQAHPERFVNGAPQHKHVPQEVWINKPFQVNDHNPISTLYTSTITAQFSLAGTGL